MKNKTKENIMNNMSLAMVRNIAYSQINKINKKIKEEIEVDSTLTKMIDINMKNAINKIINNYKQQLFKSFSQVATPRSCSSQPTTTRKIIK
jgi:low affinity Fe/Cu permease